jgi:flagellar FliJ protein
MQPVQRVAHSREQEAVRKLGQSQRHLDAQRAKLEELRAYREQYARNFTDSGVAGFEATRMQDYRLFLQRLGEAIRQQEALIEQFESQHEQTRHHWIKSRSHSQAIDKVVESYRRKERREKEHREQQEQDERARRKPVT